MAEVIDTLNQPCREGPVHPLAPNFSMAEATLLRAWRIYAMPTPAQEREIVITGLRAQQVRSILGEPCRVTSWLRPRVAVETLEALGVREILSAADWQRVLACRGDYNQFVGGATLGAHPRGQAVDLQPTRTPIAIAFERIAREAERLNIRLESLKRADGSLRNWIHLDTLAVRYAGSRIFMP